MRSLTSRAMDTVPASRQIDNAYTISTGIIPHHGNNFGFILSGIESPRILRIVYQEYRTVLWRKDFGHCLPQSHPTGNRLLRPFGIDNFICCPERYDRIVAFFYDGRIQFFGSFRSVMS